MHWAFAFSFFFQPCGPCEGYFSEFPFAPFCSQFGSAVRILLRGMESFFSYSVFPFPLVELGPHPTAAMLAPISFFCFPPFFFFGSGFPLTTHQKAVFCLGFFSPSPPLTQAVFPHPSRSFFFRWLCSHVFFFCLQPASPCALRWLFSFSRNFLFFPSDLFFFLLRLSLVFFFFPRFSPPPALCFGRQRECPIFFPFPVVFFFPFCSNDRVALTTITSLIPLLVPQALRSEHVFYQSPPRTGFSFQWFYRLSSWFIFPSRHATFCCSS